MPRSDPRFMDILAVAIGLVCFALLLLAIEGLERV
jgi:hypothetical protein